MISGRYSLKTPLKTESPQPCRTRAESTQKRQDRFGDGNSTKPPRATRRENRTGVKKSEGFDRKKLASRFGVEATVQEQHPAKCIRYGDITTQNLSNEVWDRTKGSSDQGWHSSELGDLSVSEDLNDKDVLLERILDNEQKKRRREEYVDRLTDIEVMPPTRCSPTEKHHVTDLHKLLDCDRNSLLLGQKVKLKVSDRSNVVNGGNDRYRHSSESPQRSTSIHQHSHLRNQPKHHYQHRCTDVRNSPPFIPDIQVVRRHSLQSYDTLQLRGGNSQDRVSSEIDSFNQLHKKYYEGVNRANKSLPTEEFPRSKKLQTAVPQSSSMRRPCLPFLDDINTRIALSQRHLERHNADPVDSKVSIIDRGDTGHELKDVFDPSVLRYCPGSKGKLSRKSYPNDDGLIISPPPGFDNTRNEEEEAWVKVRVVTDGLTCPPDKEDLAGESKDVTDITGYQYYAVPMEFEGTPESRFLVTQFSEDLYLPVNGSSASSHGSPADLFSKKNGGSHNAMDLSGPRRDESLTLARTWITPAESPDSEDVKEKTLGYSHGRESQSRDMQALKHEVGH